MLRFSALLKVLEVESDSSPENHSAAGRYLVSFAGEPRKWAVADKRAKGFNFLDILTLKTVKPRILDWCNVPF